MISLISLSGCTRAGLYSVCVCTPVVLGLYLFVSSCWWVLPSSGLTGSQNSHFVLYAVAQVLVNKAVLPDNQTYASKMNLLPHQQSQSQLSKINIGEERLQIL